MSLPGLLSITVFMLLSGFQFQPQPTLRVNVDEVLLHVAVTDSSNSYISNLTKNDFQIWEDKIEQNVEYFTTANAPLSVGIILDVSDSMKFGLGSARSAAETFLTASDPKNEYFLIQFSDTPRLTQDFTSDVKKVQKSLAMTKAKGNTSLYDAVYLGLETLNRGSNARKALLVITDGGDNNSRYPLSAVKEFAEEHDAMIYTVGIGVANRPEWHLPGRSPKARLKSLAEMTGGKAYFPDSARDLTDICALISTDLKSQYVLGYRSLNLSRDGRWRKVRVTVDRRTQGSGHVRTRSGYYASAIGKSSKP